MNKKAVVRARIDKELKDEGAKILEEMGLNESIAIRLLFIEIVKNKKLPFNLEVKQ